MVAVARILRAPHALFVGGIIALILLIDARFVFDRIVTVTLSNKLQDLLTLTFSGTYGGKTKLFYTAEKGESIWAYRTSPNDKYLAVSTLKPSQDAPERILRIFDVRTGKQIARINADIISWQ